MSDVRSAGSGGFAGRQHELARLTVLLDRALGGRIVLALVSGEAGIGKTSLIDRLLDDATARGISTARGTCWHSEQAPAFWPWREVLRAVLREPVAQSVVGGLGRGERAQLARVVPELGHADGSPADGSSEYARIELLTAAATLLEQAAADRPLVVVLDDLHWADPSSLDLLQIVGRRSVAVPLLVVGAYRPDEVEPGSPQARVLVELAEAAEPLRLAGLTDGEVAELVRFQVGPEIADRWAPEVARRSGGHPFFARELSHLLATRTDGGSGVPHAVQGAIGRRVARLDGTCLRMLEAASVCGKDLLPDVLATVCRIGPTQVAEQVGEAIAAGILVADGLDAAHPRFAHDLFRESIYAALPVRARVALHQRVGVALESRHCRGGVVYPGEPARHFAAAISLDGPDRALRWTQHAAEADRAGLAFLEASRHLARLREAAQDNGVDLAGETTVDLLVAEAHDRARGGDVETARSLLKQAYALARGLADPERLAAVALGVQQLGARFGMRREQVTDLLEEARTAFDGDSSATAAKVTAGLARELAHSVVADRRRAAPLSERALEIARSARDESALADCLLARHDAIWGPGTAAERLDLATEIVELAERNGDRERQTDGVLLRANALLELGSPTFRTELATHLRMATDLHQPRYDYLVHTRRAAIAMLDGRISTAERLIDEAATLGRQVAEPDVDNVRHTQTIGTCWARGDAGQLLAFADRAIAWWVGIPSFSHAVAAAFRARAGALDQARRDLAVVVELGQWKADRSYVWPANLLAAAAARLGERDLCAELYEQLAPVAGECGVNAALVCFMGSHAHWAGISAAALGRVDDAVTHLRVAVAVHERLGARAWEAESCAELATLLGPDGEPFRRRAAALSADAGQAAHVPAPQAAASAAVEAMLRSDGELWEITFGGRSARIRDAKGLHDLAVLIARTGVEVHVLDLASPQAPRTAGAAPVLDAPARAAYARRLAELDEDRAEAQDRHDLGHLARLDVEREALLTELRTAAGLGGRTRGLGADPAERARKAVTSRIRDAIRRISAVLPELAAHLDRSVTTGTTCCYRPAEPVTWRRAAQQQDR